MILHPKVSVIIPVYNCESYIFDALTSIKNQTFKDFECVIINGSSTDNTYSIIENFIVDDKRFRCFTIENMGSGNAHRTYGVSKIQSDIVFNLDADDIVAEDSIEKMYNLMSFHNADIVLQKTLCFDKELNNIIWKLPLTSFNLNTSLDGKSAFEKTIGGWEISCAGMMFKKGLYVGVPTDSLMNSDELTSRYLLYNAKQVALSDAIYYYRNHDSSISRALSPRIFERLIVDSQLDDFVSARYDEDSEIPKRMRNTRFFNLLYLHSEYYKNKRRFSKEKQLEIIKIIKDAYFSQNFELLKKELPKYKFVFFSSFKLFCINSIIYRKIKNLQRKKYILK